MKLNHILITSDLSPESLRPLEAVTQLARSAGARITLLHVVQDLKVAPHGAPFAPAVSSPELGAEVEAAKKGLAEQQSAIGEGVEVEAVVLAATDIAKAIVSYADEHGADLIAISTHGRTGLRHLALGSVAEAVIRRANVPVLSFQRQKE